MFYRSHVLEGKSFAGKIYEHLVNTAGTEIDMHTRQQHFITQDMINNTITQTLDIDKKEISSESLAEGIDLLGSDMDIMFVMKRADVIRDDRNIRHSKQRTTLVMETNNDYPGFTYLRVIAGGKVDACFKPFLKGSYLSVNIFVSHVDTKRFLLSPTARVYQIKTNKRILHFVYKVNIYHLMQYHGLRVTESNGRRIPLLTG